MSIDTTDGAEFSSGEPKSAAKKPAVPAGGKRKKRAKKAAGVRPAVTLSTDPPAGASEAWNAFHAKMSARANDQPSASVFGKSAKDGSIYRWGMAVATESAVHSTIEVISRLAAGEKLGKKWKKERAALDLVNAAELFTELAERATGSSIADACRAVTWAAALPNLCRYLSASASGRLAESLKNWHESIASRGQADSPMHLVVAGELGLTLAWQMADLDDFKRLQKNSVDAVAAWCDLGEDAVSGVMGQPKEARLVMASLIRCERLIASTTKRRVTKSLRKTGDLMATWVAALTTHGGGSALSGASRTEAADDWKTGGLLDQAAQYDAEALAPAIAAAAGAIQTGGRLAWEVSLPETMWHDAEAKLAVLLPEWDVRKGRTHLQYANDDVRMETFAGRTKIFDGPIETSIEVDGVPEHARGPWTELCEYTDDDVHYLEIEQPWTGGFLLQRQWMLVREDRTWLMADAVVPDPLSSESNEDDLVGGPSEREPVNGKSTSGRPGRAIHYQSRLPLAGGVQAKPEPETREIILGDSRPRAMAIPLAAGEWRVGPTPSTLGVSDRGALLHSCKGNGRLYAPLWIDFAPRRFKRKRTWRPLTVVNDLRLCPPSEAVGYRIQLGSEQWVVYRTLGDSACRSVLGKHLIADFFASRFDMTYGDHDALVTVDDQEPSQ